MELRSTIHHEGGVDSVTIVDNNKVAISHLDKETIDISQDKVTITVSTKYSAWGISCIDEQILYCAPDTDIKTYYEIRDRGSGHYNQCTQVMLISVFN